MELDEFGLVVPARPPPGDDGAAGDGPKARRAAPRRRPVRLHVRLREVGGLMQPLWHSYYGECTAAIFVVDASNYVTIFNAGRALNECVAALREERGDVRVLVVLNKVRRPRRRTLLPSARGRARGRRD